MSFKSHMTIALEEARAAAARGEVPIGAAIVDANGEVIARAGNEVIERHDPTAHAEMLVIRQAAKLIGNERLWECDLYVTLEPCPMCATAISFARIKRLYYGAIDPKGGGVDSGPRIFQQPTCHHTPEVYGGIDEAECSTILKNFFAERRG